MWRRVLHLAQEEAQRFQHHYIGTEHLLLGLLRLDQARAETLRALRQLQESETDTVPPPPSEAAMVLAEGEPGLTCTHCGAHCPNYFRHCFNCGQPLKPQ
jgi:hypothetical protein